MNEDDLNIFQTLIILDTDVLSSKKKTHLYVIMYTVKYCNIHGLVGMYYF